MSVRTIARKDLADAGRSKALWAVTLLVVLFTAGITGLAGATTEEPIETVFQLAFQLAVVTLPIVALILAKGAITGERESGSIRSLLSLPPSRRDILLGKFIGRTALMLVATLVGGVATGLVVMSLFGTGLDLLALFIVFLGLMGVAFVAIGIGVSAASASDTRATVFAVGIYILFVTLWDLIQGGIIEAATALGLAEASGEPPWMQFISLLPPNQAATAAYQSAVSGGRVFAGDPFTSVWFPVLVLLAWMVAPVVGGYIQFRDADIG